MRCNGSNLTKTSSTTVKGGYAVVLSFLMSPSILLPCWHSTNFTSSNRRSFTASISSIRWGTPFLWDHSWWLSLSWDISGESMLPLGSFNQSFQPQTSLRDRFRRTGSEIKVRAIEEGNGKSKCLMEWWQDEYRFPTMPFYQLQTFHNEALSRNHASGASLHDHAMHYILCHSNNTKHTDCIRNDLWLWLLTDSDMCTFVEECAFRLAVMHVSLSDI